MTCGRFFLVVALALWASAGQALAQAGDRLEIVLDPRAAPPVAGEMVEVTLRGTYGLTILRQELELPRTGDFEWLQLDRDAWSRQVVDGRSVLVMERRLALFPKRAGELRIGPFEHRLTVHGRDGRPAELSIRAAPVPIQAVPYPGGPDDATLSAEVLELTDTLSAAPAALSDGETLVRTVRIVALGAMPQMLPPRPELRQPWLITFAAPEERSMQITPDGPVSTVVWQWRLRPRTGEPGVLPEIAIPWFDTGTREMRTAVIPAIPFGYASFGTNAGGGARFGPGATAALAASAAAGFVLGLASLAAGRRAASWEELRRAARRLLSSASLRTMRRAARSGDLRALRAAAVDHLRSRRELSPEARRLLAGLDAHLFGPARSRTE